MSTEDRRAPGATRIPFDGLVEVGGALGPSFEAQAVNLSEDGMLLRTAYLPEPGQPLTCRFDAGARTEGARVRARWSGRTERRGAVSSPSASRTWTPRASTRSSARAVVGDRARPRGAGGIEGAPAHRGPRLADAREDQGFSQPARSPSAAISGFLQVGKQLELEDAQSGTKRPAAIDRVEVAIDPTSHVPQLVVTLRYSDVAADEARGADLRSTRPASGAAPARALDDGASIDEASAKMKGALAHGIGRIGPAFERFASRAKTTLALLAAAGGCAATTRMRPVAPPRRPPAAGCTRPDVAWCVASPAHPETTRRRSLESPSPGARRPSPAR